MAIQDDDTYTLDDSDEHHIIQFLKQLVLQQAMVSQGAKGTAITHSTQVNRLGNTQNWEIENDGRRSSLQNLQFQLFILTAGALSEECSKKILVTSD